MNPITFLNAPLEKPITALGDLLDKLFTSDEEKLDKQAIIERLKQEPFLQQIEINKIEAQHRSVWVAGWRPYIGWICGTALAFVTLIDPMLSWYLTIFHPEIEPFELSESRMSFLFNIMFAILGINIGARTFEKVKGVAK